MGTSHQDKFIVKSHCIEGQYKREYPHGLASDSESPRIHLKQYLPVNNVPARPESITIVAAGGNGLIKELYEPLFEDLCKELEQRGLHVRSLWIADMYVQGASAIANVSVRGNDPSWWDHSRDLLHMINVFRNEMQDPLIGLGHSVGAAQIAYLSTLHPRLFASLILMEPQIHDGVDTAAVVAQFRGVGRRRESWPCWSEGEKAFRKSPFYANWDSRVVDRLVKYSFTNNLNPSLASYSTLSERNPENSSPDPVRTSTPRDMEIAMLARLNIEGVGKLPPSSISLEAKDSVPDLDARAKSTYPLYRAEPTAAYMLLPSLRPSVIWICSEESPSSLPHARETWLHSTGTGVGGSGGVAGGRVSLHVVPGGSHFLPLDDKLGEVVQVAQRWLAMEISNWRERDAKYNQTWKLQPLDERQKLHPLLRKVIEEYRPKNESLETFVNRHTKVTPKL